MEGTTLSAEVVGQFHSAEGDLIVVGAHTEYGYHAVTQEVPMALINAPTKAAPTNVAPTNAQVSTAGFLNELCIKCEFLASNVAAGADKNMVEFGMVAQALTVELIGLLSQAPKLTMPQGTQCMKVLGSSDFSLQQRQALIDAINANTERSSKPKVSNNNQPMVSFFHMHRFLTARDWYGCKSGQAVPTLVSRAQSLGCLTPSEMTFAHWAAIAGLTNKERFPDAPGSGAFVDGFAIVKDLKQYFKNTKKHVLTGKTPTTTFPDTPAEFQRTYPEIFKAAYGDVDQQPDLAPLPPQVNELEYKQLALKIPLRETNAQLQVVANQPRRPKSSTAPDLQALLMQILTNGFPRHTQARDDEDMLPGFKLNSKTKSLNEHVARTSDVPRLTTHEPTELVVQKVGATETPTAQEILKETKSEEPAESLSLKTASVRDVADHILATVRGQPGDPAKQPAANTIQTKPAQTIKKRPAANTIQKTAAAVEKHKPAKKHKPAQKHTDATVNIRDLKMTDIVKGAEALKIGDMKVYTDLRSKLWRVKRSGEKKKIKHSPSRKMLRVVGKG